jgi:hypothetical protein
MINDKRRATRRPMRYAAWIALQPSQLHGCALHDISDTGARIDVEDAKIIPDNFVLLLAGNGKARRKCQIVWRKPKQIGVTFAKPLVATDRATLVPKLDADLSTLAPWLNEPDVEPAEND